MKNFNRALQHCLNAIDLGIDLESCLSVYPEYEEQLREFFRKWDGTRNRFKAAPDLTLEQLMFNQALDECIKAVGSGVNPASCYERYPSYARKMRPWLEAVSDLPRLRSEGLLESEPIFDEFFIPDIPFTQALEEYIQAHKNKESYVVLKRYPYYAERLIFWADKIPDQPELILTPPQPVVTRRLPIRINNLFSNLPLQASAAALLALLLFLSSGLGLARAAAATIPGDSLYPLKLIAEQIHLNIVPNDQKSELKAQFEEERRQEASALIQANIKEDVAFDGEITLIDQNKALVSNVVVLLHGFDKIVPVFAKGERVHIEGYTGQNGVVVQRIDVRSSNGASRTFVAPTPPPALLSNVLNPTPISVTQGTQTPFFGNVITSTKPTVKPTVAISSSPLENPKPPPTTAPTDIPIPAPTPAPTSLPTSVPTEIPTSAPTSLPTDVPTSEPTIAPTEAPTPEPTSLPTDVPPPPPAPTAAPTDNPPPEPTSVPTDNPPPPTLIPLDYPTPEPTISLP